MFLIALWLHFFVQVLSGAPPAPPQNIRVDNWLLTWTPAAEDADVNYTVQYSRFDSDVWTDVPDCVRISSRSCRVLFTKAQAEHGCVKLRVQAQRNGLISIPAEACSQQGESCTPYYSLTARPGTLTVHLSRNHSLAQDNGDHAKHRIYYGKEGDSLEETFVDRVSSVTIHGLQEGQRYCTRVQHIVYYKPVGLSSCAQCVLIPESKNDTQHTGVIAAVVTVVVMAILISMTVYIFLFQHKRIKECVKPPFEIPDDYFLRSFPEHRRPVYVSAPTEERYDVISCFTQEESRE